MITFDEFCVNGSRVGVRMDSSNPAFEAFMEAVDKRAALNGQDHPSLWRCNRDTFIIFGYSINNWFQRGSINIAGTISVTIVEPDQVDVDESMKQLDVEQLLSMLLV